MIKKEEFIAESYKITINTGYHGEIHIRPVADSLNFKRSMHVECSKKLSDLNVYPLGTKFLLKGSLKKPKKAGDTISIYSYYGDKIKVVSLVTK